MMIKTSDRPANPASPADTSQASGVVPLKVLVCFKAVADLEALTEVDWQPDEHFQIDTRFVKTIINPLDESALELALKLRDQAGVNLTALTLGDKRADEILKTLNALRFNRTVRVETRSDPFNSEHTAALISYFISQNNYQLAVFGGRSADGDNGRTPLLVGEMLGWPVLTQVIGFENHDHLEVTRLTDDGQLTEVVTGPMVLAVGNAPSSYMRIPTLKDRLAHGKKEIEIYPEPQITTPAPSYELKTLTYQRSTRSALVVEGATAAEKAARLYFDHLKGRL